MKPTAVGLLLRGGPFVLSFGLALLILAAIGSAPQRAFARENERGTFFLLYVAVALLALGSWRLAAFLRWRRRVEGLPRET